MSGDVIVNAPLQRDIAAVVRLTVIVSDITAPTLQQGKGNALLIKFTLLIFYLFIAFSTCIMVPPSFVTFLSVINCIRMV